MPATDFKRLQAVASAQRSERRALEADYRQARETIRALEAHYSALQVRGDLVSPELLGEVRRQIETMADIVRGTGTAFEAADRNYNDVRTQMAHISPRNGVGACDDRFPFLLCPVRLECRFVEVGAELQLQLRVYPDRISIDNLDELLTTTEIQSAEAFWTAIWRAGGAAADELSAWRELAAVHGANRAAWIARTHAPTNETGAGGVSNRPSAPLAESEILAPPPEFPAAAGRPDSWSRAPRTMGLPDQFVAMGYVDGKQVFEITGAPVPETLMTGPDPVSGDDDDETGLDPEMAWMVDFDKAVAVGMGMRITLPAAALGGLDELVVLGVRWSSDAAQGEDMAAALIRTHLYGPDGLSLVLQGTPTNDLGPGSAPTAANVVDAAYAREFGSPPPGPPGGWPRTTDGEHFARALGIDPALLRPAANADGYDQTDVLAMNHALWHATLGAYLEDMARPLLGAGTIDATKRLFTNHVSGRGPVPAFRVGNQPYGVLVSSVLSRWVPELFAPKFSGGPKRPDPFRTRLAALINRVDSVWAGLADDVGMLGAGADTQAALLDVLGLQPRSASFHQRFAVSLDQVTNAQNLFGAGSFSNAMAKLTAAKSQQVLTALGIPATATPEIFKKIFFNTANRLSGPFVDSAPLSEQTMLPAISQDGENYLLWLATSDIDTLRRQDFGKIGGVGVAAPTALLYLMLRQALQNAYWDAGWNLLTNARPDIELPRSDPIMTGIIADEVPLSKYQLLYQDAGILAEAYPGRFQAGSVIARSLSDPDTIATLPESADLHAARQACEWLSHRPTAAVARAFAEHIDLCSVRADAWVLAFSNERLAALRARPVSERGIYVGAYGYLRDLRPKPAAQPYAGPIPAELTASAPAMEQAEAEYVLAPSLNQAVTSAILRSAYLTHATPTNAATMGVDISSTRIRRALDLLDGVRNGQELGEILGFWFERGLHDRHGQAEVDKYIYPLRQKFPLASGQQVATPPGTPITSVEARNVLDGRKLIRRIQTTGVRNYPFGYADLPMPPAGQEAETQAIDAEVAGLIDALDAVADLMLVEGTFNATLGNFERAGAALDAISGAPTFPDPDVVQTRRSGHGLTHRLCLMLPAAPPIAPLDEENPVFALSPRAQMEPALDAWLDGLLGDVRSIFCRVRWTVETTPKEADLPLYAAGVHPIDLLYMLEPEAVSVTRELDMRIAFAVRRIEGLADDAPVEVSYAERIEGRITLFELLPMIRAIKGLCLGRRRLGARDYAPPSKADLVSESTAAAANGWEVDSYAQRVTAAAGIAERLGIALKAAAAALQVETPAHDAFDRIRILLLCAAGYGIAGAIPVSVAGNGAAAIEALVAQATRIAAILAARIDAFREAQPASASLPADLLIDQWTAAARQIFGDDFMPLPPFRLGADQMDEIEAAYAARGTILGHAGAADPFPMESWIAGLARVREAPAHVERIRTLAQIFGHAEPELVPLQLPYRIHDSWMGLELPEDYPFGPDPVLATTIFTDRPDVRVALAGLVLDEWTESIPVREQTAGVAFRFDSPGAEAPQALILAVTPEITGNWKWDDLTDTVRDAFRLARQRAVEPRHIDGSPFAQLLPAIMVPFTALGNTIGDSLLVNVIDTRTPGSQSA